MDSTPPAVDDAAITSPVSTTTATSVPPAPPANVQWSGLIKGVHQTLREAVMGADNNSNKPTSSTRKQHNNKKVGGGKRGRDFNEADNEATTTTTHTIPTSTTTNINSSSTAGVVPLSEVVDTRAESYLRWQAFKDQHADQLEAYAVSMRNLAVEYWDGTRSTTTTTTSATKTNTPLAASSTITSTNNDDHPHQQPNGGDEKVFSQRTGKYDDRVGDVVGFIADYFLGDLQLQPSTTTTTTITSAFIKLPTLVTMDLRKHRKDYFVQHGVTLPPTEEDIIVGTQILPPRDDADSMINSVVSCEPALAGGKKDVGGSVGSKYITSKLWSHLVTTHQGHPYQEETSTTTSVMIPMDVLDVGSCYGPFQSMGERFRSLCSPNIEVCPTVTSLDLCPYPSSSVIKCDWLEVPFSVSTPPSPYNVTNPSSSSSPHCNTQIVTSSPSSHSSSMMSPQPPPPPFFELKEFSKDAVIFCLLLSFMPTREMRFRSCVNAFRALRDDGLLVIVSTKTQGSRDVMNSWVRGWKACIEAIGFRAVHQIIKSKLVYLSFRRVSLDTTTTTTPSTATITPPSSLAEVSTTTASPSTPPLVTATRCWSNVAVREHYSYDFEAFYQAVYLPIFEGMPKDAMGLNNDSI